MITCAHAVPLVDPCEACSEQMSTKDRIKMTGERVAVLQDRMLDTRYAMREFEALLIRRRIENEDPQ